MMFTVNLRRKSVGASRARVTLSLSLILCLSILAWAQEAPRPEGSTLIKPPMIKPPMGKSRVTKGSSVSSRRRKAKRRKRSARKNTRSYAVVMTPAEGEQPNAEPTGAGGAGSTGSGAPAIKPPMANENDAPLTAPAPRAPVSGGILNGRAVMLPRPAYPAIARSARASGTVVVEITIDEEGNVISARAVSGHPLLQSSAVAAAREAKFTPTKIDGQPVKVTGKLKYEFVLPPPGSREGARR